MLSHVVHHVLLSGEGLCTVLATIWRLPSVASGVVVQVLLSGKRLTTYCANIRFVTSMTL